MRDMSIKGTELTSVSTGWKEATYDRAEVQKQGHSKQ